MSHRNIASTLKVSHGSVSLEKRVMLTEERIQKETQNVKEQAEAQKDLKIIDPSSPW